MLDLYTNWTLKQLLLRRFYYRGSGYRPDCRRSISQPESPVLYNALLDGVVKLFRPVAVKLADL